MGRIVVFLLAAVVPASVAVAQSRTTNTLDIYVIDVEGGNAVLFATPSGESVLVDTGNGGDAAVRHRSPLAAQQPRLVSSLFDNFYVCDPTCPTIVA